MTELEQNMNQGNSKSDISRARQRKIRRDGSSKNPNAESDSTSHRRARQRSTRLNGPSVRERLAATRNTIQTPKLKSIQGKLGSTLDRVTHMPDPGETARKTINNIGKNRDSARRKPENQRTESRYEATPRAETQRKAAANQPFLPRKNRRQYDARSEATPPVMVRGGMGGMAFGRVASSRMHKQKAPRRRFDVPLSIPGAEVRLPSIPLIRLGWRAVSFLMVLMMSACLFLMWKAPVFQVSAVEAEGLQRLTLGDLNAVMGTFGRSVFSIDPKVLQQTLQQAFPELAEISVQVNLPANVKVKVSEREPVIAWIKDGTEIWVDAEGISFPPRGTPANPLISVDGYGDPPSIQTGEPEFDPQALPGELTPTSAPKNASSFRLSPELVASILSMGATMPADTQLVYDSEHGLGWDDPNGWEVYFGVENQDMEMKLIVYQAMVERLKNEGIQPAIISVEYVHAPYYRMER